MHVKTPGWSLFKGFRHSQVSSNDSWRSSVLKQLTMKIVHPKASVISPDLFNVMINHIFPKMLSKVLGSLYLWIMTPSGGERKLVQ